MRAFLLLVLLAGGCARDDEPNSITVLRVAVLPDQSEARLREKYKPLLEYVRSSTGLDYQLLVPESYQQLLDWFDAKQVDLALFGGVTFVTAHRRSGALPLVMRDVDKQFRSVALVRADHSATSLEDLKGSSFSFGSRLSTSGHLMPRYFFQQHGIVPEAFFGTVQYSGAHDLTAEWVRDGVVDVGVANSGVVVEMFADGRLNDGEVKIIWQSPAFADYVWAVQPDISKQQRSLIRDAFLLIGQVEDGPQLLKFLGAGYYIPANRDDFSILEAIISDQTKNLPRP